MCAGLLLGVIGAQLVVVALFSASGLRGPAFPGVPLVAALPAAAALSAWGLRHIPRPLAVLLGLFSLAGSAWLILAERSGNLGGWLEVDTSLPWGPPVNVFPNFTGEALWPAVLCGLLAAGALALVIRERRAAGEWRRAAAASRTSKAMH